jgi:hypothetical protein
MTANGDGTSSKVWLGARPTIESVRGRCYWGEQEVVWSARRAEPCATARLLLVRNSTWLAPAAAPGKSTRLETETITLANGSTRNVELYARGGAVGIGELTERGDLLFAELLRVRTHRNQDKSGKFAGTTTTDSRRSSEREWSPSVSTAPPTTPHGS